MRVSLASFAPILLASLALSQMSTGAMAHIGMVGDILGGVASGLAGESAARGLGHGLAGGLAAGAVGAVTNELANVAGAAGPLGGLVGAARHLASPLGHVSSVMKGVGAMENQIMAAPLTLGAAGAAAAASAGARMGAASAAGAGPLLAAGAAGAAAGAAANAAASGYGSPYGPYGASPYGAAYNLRKREAIANGLAAGEAMSAGAAAGAAAATLGAAETLGAAGPAAAAGFYGPEAAAAHGAAAMAGAAAAAGAGEPALAGPAAAAGAAAAAAATGAALAAPLAAAAAASPLTGPGRQLLAADAIGNAQAESAIAGADMIAHGANNARSASLAGNAYRQAKLATARDRVNIAGTIQNSARISDAAIATHDAATKAEDSLLGSELAVDSAATVLDSDAAYIPPVTNSLLRSLPYGRLGIRNILPKPLTYPSTLLPDVWLNGVPVNYFNMPLRGLPYGISPANTLLGSSLGLANGQIINGQPFFATNGPLLNGMPVFDPTLAYLTSPLAGPAGILTSSLYPILHNGQLEAHEELALANAIGQQQQNGPGMAGTYNAFGRRNPVPMITGSVSDANLQPTTNIGTTYPIGSALVIQPRDSYFQDYIDNASSRQNFDERHQ